MTVLTYSNFHTCVGAKARADMKYAVFVSRTAHDPITCTYACHNAVALATSLKSGMWDPDSFLGGENYERPTRGKGKGPKPDDGGEVDGGADGGEVDGGGDGNGAGGGSSSDFGSEHGGQSDDGGDHSEPARDTGNSAEDTGDNSRTERGGAQDGCTGVHNAIPGVPTQRQALAPLHNTAGGATVLHQGHADGGDGGRVFSCGGCTPQWTPKMNCKPYATLGELEGRVLLNSRAHESTYT